MKIIIWDLFSPSYLLWPFLWHQYPFCACLLGNESFTVFFPQCQNLHDSEHLTWLIVNHIQDLINLSHEPPVQDFISAVHRNSAASGLFIQAIQSRCENLSAVSLSSDDCCQSVFFSALNTYRRNFETADFQLAKSCALSAFLLPASSPPP